MKPWPYLCAAALLLPAVAAADTIRDQLYRLPDSVNAVAVINMDTVIKSPRGLREGWAKLHQSEILGGCIPINPAVDRIVIGSQYDPSQGTAPWSIALVNLGPGLNIERVAAAYRGRLETVDGKKVAATPRGYFGEVQPGLLAGVTGKNRSDFLKYLRFAKDNGKLVLSPYLVESVQNAYPTPIVLAFDIHDAFDATTVAKYIEASEALAGKKEVAQPIQQFLAGLKGVRIAIEIGEVMKATVTLDGVVPFAGDPNALKAFLLETLAHGGANLDILSQAVPKPAANGVAFITDLSDVGLMRLMTLLHVPPAPPAAPAVKPSPEATREAQVAATKRYYNAISAMLDDLNAEYMRATKYSSTANWHEGYARRIEALPKVDVDQLAIAWGEATAYDLRALAASLRGVGLNIQKLEGQIQIGISGIYGGGWGWGGGGVMLDTNLGEVRKQQTASVQKGQADRATVWQTIQSDRNQVREKMQQKYGVDIGSR